MQALSGPRRFDEILHACAVPPTSSAPDVSDAVRAWETSDAAVARWLATQLDHPELCSLLDNFNPPQLVDGCWTLVEASEAAGTVDAPSVPARQPPKSSLLSRLQDISKQQMISHIRRLLISHPECISEAFECVQHLQIASVSTVAASPTTASKPASRPSAPRSVSESLP
ncbi:unnamed protein product [Dibothriocephalus latus]|uniref:Uncharacterized protein n=1 Tax=Dibothriocephalus latus TaxID=60516 RepID=A0A3P7LHL0_DIBLA|nr:unnamed protein product [Dibothriocephalus latus]